MSEFVPNPAAIAELEASPAFHAAMDLLGNEALAQMKTRIPVDTGALLASARVIHLPGGGQRLEVGTDHWFYPEFGTSVMAAEPYLRPTLSGLHI